MRKLVSAVFSAVAMMALTAVVVTAAPPTIPYQGRLTDAGGAVINGAQDLEVTLYNASNTVLYKETFTAVSVTNGLFSIEVGSGTPVTGTYAGVNFGTFDLYLGIKVGADPEMAPKIHLGAAPYAVKSYDAVGLSSNHSTGFVSLPASGNISLVSTTITTPGPGWILVMAGGQMYLPANVLTSVSFSETGGAALDGNDYGNVAAPSSGGAYIQYERHRVYRKNAAGTFTFHLNASGNATTGGYLWQPTATAIFIPTNFGTVTPAPLTGMTPARQPAEGK